MKTPIEQIIDRLEELYEANPLDRDYRAGLAEAIGIARNHLPIERSHIKAAWRAGGEEIITQTATDYFRNLYERD